MLHNTYFLQAHSTTSVITSVTRLPAPAAPATMNAVLVLTFDPVSFAFSKTNVEYFHYYACTSTPWPQDCLVGTDILRGLYI